jgi:hypothetical protein
MENENVTNIENSNVENTQSTNTNVDMNKLSEIINRGLEKKESAILKSYFEQNGLNDEEMAQAIKSYKDNKAKETADINTTNTNLQNEVNSLKELLNNERLDNKINLTLIETGINKEQIPYITKLVDRSSLLKDGVVNEEALKGEIEKIFNTFPNLKPLKEETKNLVKIGTEQNQEAVNEDDLLRKAFGLKNKK